MKDIREMEERFREYSKVGKTRAERNSAKIVARTFQNLVGLQEEGALTIPEKLIFPSLPEPAHPHNYPHEYRNPRGYIELAQRLTFIRWDQNTPEGRADIEKLKAIHEDPQELGKLIDGLEKALDTLDENFYRAINLRYGLDNPGNEGKNFKDVGARMGISDSSARNLVARGERCLYHPARSKHFKPLIHQWMA